MGVELELSFDGKELLQMILVFPFNWDFLGCRKGGPRMTILIAKKLTIRVDEAAILNVMVVAVKGEDENWIYFYTKWEMPGLL